MEQRKIEAQPVYFFMQLNCQVKIREHAEAPKSAEENALQRKSSIQRKDLASKATAFNIL